MLRLGVSHSVTHGPDQVGFGLQHVSPPSIFFHAKLIKCCQRFSSSSKAPWQRGYSPAAQPVAWPRAISIVMGAPVRCSNRTSPVRAGWRCVCSSRNISGRVSAYHPKRTFGDETIVCCSRSGHLFFFELSHQRAIGSKKFATFVQVFSPNGDPGPIRTGGLRFRKPLLYPAELRGRWGIQHASPAHFNISLGIRNAQFRPRLPFGAVRQPLSSGCPWR